MNTRVGSFALLGLIACMACKGSSGDGASTGRTAELATAPATTLSAMPSAPPRSTGAGPDVVDDRSPPPWELGTDDLLGASYQLDVKRAQSVGHTSVVFKLTFADGKVAAFKPTTKRGGHRYRGELATRRLALALGVGRFVPPTTPFHIQKSMLKAAGAGPLVDEELTDQGLVYGALIPWIKDLSFPPLEREPEVSRWKKWISGEVVPSAAELKDAVAMSTLVVLDYMTGNFDRFSGGNIGRSQGQLLFIDNDGTFLDPMPKEAQERNAARLHETRRFSKDFAYRIKHFRKQGVIGLLGRDLGNQALLTPAAAEGLLKRMDEVIAYIDETTTKLGEGVALPWP